MRLRSLGGVAAFSILILALTVPAFQLRAAGTFVDDDGSVHEADIEWIAAEGITRGCNPPTNDRYCPDDPVTRGQMAAFLHRALDDILTPGDPVEFVDDDGSTFEADIEWLAATGVTKGCNPPTNDRYCPADPVTRAQMASFLRRALEPLSPDGVSSTSSTTSSSTTVSSTTTSSSTTTPTTLPELDFSDAIWVDVLDGTGPNPRHEAGQVLHNGDTLFLIGGRRTQPTEWFDLSDSDSWTDTPEDDEVHFHHFQPVTADGQIYLMGAMSGGCCLADKETPFPNVQEFDPVTGEITDGDLIPADRRRGSAGAVEHDGLIYLAGGLTAGHEPGVTQTLAYFDRYNPSNGDWETLEDIPHARDHFQAAIVGDRIYLIGGRRTEESDFLAQVNQVGPVDVYDISDGVWLTNHGIDPIPVLRSGALTAVVGRYIFIIGGEGGTGHTSGDAHHRIDVLDTATGNWITGLPSIDPPRHGTGATVCGLDIYVASGNKEVGGSNLTESDDFQALDLLGDELDGC